MPRIERNGLPLRQRGMDAIMTIPIQRENEHRPERIADLRRAAVLSEIEQRNGEPDLNPAAVASLLGITPRYLHMLLKQTGRTFGRHVQEKRLERAAALLRDPQWHHRTITDVAATVGFNDLAHFSRTFRRRYGAAPSDVRAAARNGHAHQE
jgi:AraC-like DNA-binding protein